MLTSPSRNQDLSVCMVVKIEIYRSALRVFTPDKAGKASVRRQVWGI